MQAYSPDDLDAMMGGMDDMMGDPYRDSGGNFADMEF